MKNSSFIRDLLVKLLLIVIFIFLLMYLFPMPNLSPFYSSIFNDNIQTMKDAAEDYYTTERMPKEVGKSTKMSLKEMIDKKLIIPFVDKDGNKCDTNNSYVQVTKEKTEYELKVSLTCGKESNYIIEKIGCYNFCPTGNCTLAEAKTSEPKTVTTNTDSNGYVTVVVPTGKYVTEYEYTKTNTIDNWTLGDWRTTKVNETDSVKLVDTRTQYTGQKKVTSGSKLYEQIAYGYKDNWTYDDKWTSIVKQVTDNLKIWQERTIYTGQKKVETKTTEYKHIKYGYKDNWTYDENWTTEVKETNDKLKLWKERTLYTGQKKVVTKKTEYKHVKYDVTEKWTETGYSTTKRTENENVKLIGTRYTVKKDVTTYKTTCEGNTVDSTWYTSKPADTSTRVYNSTPVNSRTVTGDWVVIDNSLRTRQDHSVYEGNRWYEKLDEYYDVCTYACNGNALVKIYVFRVYERSTTNQYQYSYCTVKSVPSVTTDTKVVTNLKEYTDKGYTLIKTEYDYKVKTTIKNVVDTKWTTSKTSPSGYEYTGESRQAGTVTYEQLDKWVTNKDLLGEYIYNIKTVKQYKYAYNNPTKYIIDTRWTTSKTSPEGYEYTGETKTTTKVSYEDLGKYVTSMEKLGQYTYNIKTKKQYKYMYNNPTKYVKDTIWTTENVAREGYELTGNVKDTTKTTYIDLGIWVNSKSELGEYTYNIQTRTQYRYKYKDTKTTTDTIWSETDPGNGYKKTGNSRKKYVSTGYRTETNRQK